MEAILTAALFAATVAIAIGAPPVLGQSYPSKPIRLIIPFAPGGGLDIAGRALSPKLGEYLGQPVLVENRAGNSSHIGSQMVAQAAPDGYTILLTAVGTLATSPHLQKLDYDPLTDLAPIVFVGSAGLGIAVNASIPVQNILELVRYANQTPKGIFYSVSALGTMPHLAGELFKIAAKVNWNHVVYKGAGPAALAVVAGEVPASLVDLTALSPQANAGKIRILAVTGSARSLVAQQVPTVAEAGFPGYAADAWTGIFGPGAMPGPLVARLHAEINRVMETPEVRTTFLKTGTEPRSITNEQFRRLVLEDNRKWGQVIRSGNIKVE
ncbi:MAG: tripartite tricarboxylate transporter substrate binding protein [Betaproteobacteria bacterium]|nr:tripartite tricarboxylate transporter substrate binding protein [Betaproteobacteria bacterium]